MSDLRIFLWIAVFVVVLPFFAFLIMKAGTYGFYMGQFAFFDHLEKKGDIKWLDEENGKE